MKTCLLVYLAVLTTLVSVDTIQGRGTPPIIRPCPGGQIRKKCASPCQATCRNPNPPCIARCDVNKCECPDEAPIWYKWKCITLSQCPSRPSRRICFLPSDPGPCRGAFPRYYYNFRSGHCEKFTYGGCAGNENNFQTVAACKQACKRRPSTSVCDLPSDSGPCYAAIPRYYYNSDSGHCEEFTYGGCAGNENNFETVAACKQACKRRPSTSVCDLPSDSGPCYAAIPRYYYNSGSGHCEEFTYGGCAGNENNFETVAACKQACKRT